MSLADEDEFRDAARTIEEKLSGWIVVWGVYTRQFVAFPLFEAPQGTIVVASYPDSLVEQIQEAERYLRSPAKKGDFYVYRT